LNNTLAMSAVREPTWEREARSAAGVRRCEACGETLRAGGLCLECRERARPHVEDDPYDDLGGEEGAGA
jgi:ribosomal protein L32